MAVSSIAWLGPRVFSNNNVNRLLSPSSSGLFDLVDVAEISRRGTTAGMLNLCIGCPILPRFQEREMRSANTLSRLHKLIARETAGESACGCRWKVEVINSGNAERPAVRCIAWLGFGVTINLCISGKKTHVIRRKQQRERDDRGEPHGN